MNIKAYIKHLNDEIAEIHNRINVLYELAALIPETFPVEPSKGPESVDFDNLTREQVVELMQYLKAGKWEKLPGQREDCIHYINRTAFSMPVRLYNAAPPASCKLVEYEELVPAQPAQIVKRFKVVCLEGGQVA